MIFSLSINGLLEGKPMKIKRYLFIVAAVIMLLAGSCKIIANHPPVVTIGKLIVTPENPKYVKKVPEGYQILIGWSCDIECIISDASDDLIYQWSCDGGKICGGGPVVTWMAPNGRDEVTITVTVSGAGSSATSKSIVFQVEDSPCAFECD